MERIPPGEYLHSPLLQRVMTLKSSVRERGEEMMFKLADETVDFDKRLNERLEDRGFDRILKEGVPEWYKLVGGTPEYHDIDAVARVMILEEIERFIDTFMTENGLDEMSVKEL